MKRFFFLFFLFCGALHAQGVRFDSQVVQQGSIANVRNAVVIPSAPIISFCNAPANAVPCTNKATTYRDAQLSAGLGACPTATQIVLDGTTNCVASPDVQNNWGVWLAPGQYAYTVTVNGINQGPWYVTAVNGNNTVFVDGTKYPLTAAGINSAMASFAGGPGIVQVPTPGNYSDTVIACPKGGIHLVFGAGTFTHAGITVPDSASDATGTCSVSGQGVDRTTLLLANNINADSIADANFSTFTGGTNFWGTVHATIDNLTIDGNKANETSGFCVRIYGRANFIHDFDFKNCKQDAIWMEWGGTPSFTLPTGDLEWRITAGKVRFTGGQGITNKAKSDALITDVVSYQIGSGWGIETFYSVHLSKFNAYLLGAVTGGCHANATGAGGAAFFGSDIECTNSSGTGLLIDPAASASNISGGVFAATGGTALSIGTQNNIITGVCANSTTCLAFTNAAANGNNITLATYGETAGPLVAWGGFGGDSVVNITGNGAGTMFAGGVPVQAQVSVDVIGVTGNPFTQLGTMRGTTALNTGALGGAGCETTITVAAAGATTGSKILWSYATDPSAVAGYGGAPIDAIHLLAWPTAGNVNFKQCSSVAVTPGALSILWSVLN